MSKDIKAGDVHLKELSDEKKRMIKKFVIDYMDKVIARQGQRRASTQQEKMPSDSVSTGTPQVPESTPREHKEMERDKIAVVDDGGSTKPLSPREVLKSLEVLGRESDKR